MREKCRQFLTIITKSVFHKRKIFVLRKIQRLKVYNLALQLVFHVGVQGVLNGCVGTGTEILCPEKLTKP